AVWWIRQSILQAIAEQSRIVRLPLNKVAHISKVNKMISKIEQDLEKDVDIYEVAEACDMNTDEVKDAMLFNNRSISLDAPVSSNEDAVTLLDLLPENEDNTKPDKELEKESLRKDLERIIQTLPPREADILNAAYGLNGMQALSLEEISAKFNLTKERVRQIKDKALTRLKSYSKTEILKMYIA
ncbi:MAG: sigma-70 family RNA polymerase sigma factor, partial [Bacteroidia bacterium]|nr:sigma-70 family RNA polymerase sigma factor [Bacteroidia bacterium]